MPTSFLTDTFTDTAGTALQSHTVDSGGPASLITGLTASAQITAGNRLRAATAAAIIGYQYAAAPAGADYDVNCDIYFASIPSDASAAGPVLRVQSGVQTYYWGRVNLDPAKPGGAFFGYDLYKCVAGTFTLLSISGSTTFTAGQTIQLKLSARGSAISLWASIDGGATFTTVCSATDTAITTAGQAGIGFYAQTAPTDSTGAQVDNLSAMSQLRIAPDNAAWFASPGNWIVNSTAAISADLGAKRSIVVSGTTSASLSFDVSVLVSAGVSTGDYPQIRYAIDSGTTTDVGVSASVSLFTGATTGSHEITYEFVRGNYSVDNYTTPVMAIRETGLLLDIAGSVSSPTDLQADRMFVAGDSITAGLAMLSTANPGGIDATSTFAKALGPALGAEVGIGGKGAVGWAFAGAANVPAFTTCWKNCWSGQPRPFPTSPALKRFVVEMGTNDGLNSISDSAVTSAVTNWIADAIATLGSSTWIHIAIPFGGFKRSAITTGINTYLASHSSAKVACIDLGNTYQTGLTGPQYTSTRAAPSDGLHPGIITHGQLAAAMAAAIKGAETSATISPTRSVGGGVLGGI